MMGATGALPPFLQLPPQEHIGCVGRDWLRLGQAGHTQGGQRVREANHRSY
jgi:hypothetical protein